MKRLLEIAVFSYEAARIAAESGAERLELCSSYAEGGISPSPGTVEKIRAEFSIPVFVMVRPRGGNFSYSSHEIDTMKRDIAFYQKVGMNGIVLGTLTNENRIDEKALKQLLPEISLPVTFHRAFDLCPDREEALQILIDAGIKRILSSGGETDALNGATEIARLNSIANGKISFIPGGGISVSNIADIAAITGCNEFHASARMKNNTTENSAAFGEHVLPDPKLILEMQNKIR